MNRYKSLIAPLCALLVIMAVSLAFFFPDSVDGNVLRQYDVQQGIANSHELNEYKATTGETAWWTNSLFGGMPAFQIAPDYGPGHLFSWLNSVFGLFLPAPSNLLAMMMVGMFILLLAMKMRTGMALIGAVAWGLSSYFVIIIGAGHLWKFLTLAYVPPTIAGIIMIYSGRRLLGAGVAALFMMLQIASNHVQMTYYFSWVMLGFVIVYAIEARRRRQMRRWGIDTAILAGAMLLAVAANAPSLYHTYKYSKETIRGSHSELVAPDENSTDGLDRSYITQHSYGLTETLSLMIPDIKGGASALPVKGQATATSLASTDEGKQLTLQDPDMALLQLFSPYHGGAEGTQGPVYVGVIILALALFGAIVVRGPMKWMLVALTLLSVFLAWGRNMQWFTDLFIDWMPMYSKFRTVESILVIAEFTIPVLAIMGLNALVRADSRKAMLKPLAVSFGVLGFVCLVGALLPSVYGADVMGERDKAVIEQYIAMGMLPAGFDMTFYPSVLRAVEDMRLDAISSDCWRSLLLLAVGAGALWMLIAGKAKASVVMAIVGVAVVADLYTADKRYLNSDSFVPAPSGAPVAATEADKAIMADSDPHFRVMDFDRFGSAEPSYFHKMIGGYHAAKLTRMEDLINTRINEADTWNMLNARYVVAGGQVYPNPDALGNAWFVDGVTYVDGAAAEMDALGLIDPAVQAVADAKFRDVLGNPAPASPGDRIELTAYAPDRLEYDAMTRNGALAVFSEVYFPWGWNVTIDGEPVELGRVDYVLRALPVPAGGHKITMEFRPASIAVTSTIAYVAIIAVYLLLIAGGLLYLQRKNVFCKQA